MSEGRSVRTPPDDGAGPGISGRLVLLLAIASGAAVANLWYAQPLLHTLARAFGVSNGSAGLLITVTQVGYVVGLALLQRSVLGLGREEPILRQRIVVNPSKTCA